MARQRQPGRLEDLLRAGRLVFAQRGIAGATIEEVAASAGIAKGTFYLYFQSKNDLVTALRQRFADDLVAAMSVHARAGSDGDWLSLARRQLESAIDTYLDNAPLLHVLFQEGAGAHGADSTDQAWSTAITESITEMIRHGMAAGVFEVQDPEVTARLLFHAVHGVVHDALHAPATLHRARVRDAAWALVARAL
ncbi:TetR/AcrR family transcriptional regulator, partial [Candidatus Binatia bacterium]|nr:TetR/AcrR family transcriptional regulator [Candidatus Binatia bacterium]